MIMSEEEAHAMACPLSLAREKPVRCRASACPWWTWWSSPSLPENVAPERPRSPVPVGRCGHIPAPDAVHVHIQQGLSRSTLLTADSTDGEII